MEGDAGAPAEQPFLLLAAGTINLATAMKNHGCKNVSARHARAGGVGSEGPSRAGGRTGGQWLAAGSGPSCCRLRVICNGPPWPIPPLAPPCAQLVFSSSCTVYGNPQYVPIDEKHPREAVSPYGRTKLMIEEIFE